MSRQHFGKGADGGAGASSVDSHTLFPRTDVHPPLAPVFVYLPAIMGVNAQLISPDTNSSYKVLFLGNDDTGKTTLISAIAQANSDHTSTIYEQYTDPTLGVTYTLHGTANIENAQATLEYHLGTAAIVMIMGKEIETIKQWHRICQYTRRGFSLFQGSYYRVTYTLQDIQLMPISREELDEELHPDHLTAIQGKDSIRLAGLQLLKAATDSLHADAKDTTSKKMRC